MKHLVIIAGSALVLGTAAGLILPPPAEQAETPVNREAVPDPVPAPETVKRVKPCSTVSFAAELKQNRACIWYPHVQDKQNYTALSFFAGRCVYSSVNAGIAVRTQEISMPAAGAGRAHIECGIRDSLTEIYCNGQYLTELYIDRGSRPCIGMGRGIDPGTIQYRPLASPFLKDDFMRVEGETGEWDAVSGEWKIESIHNPSMSANAFSFAGKGNHAAALAGSTVWSNYYFEISLNFEKGSETGVITSYTDSDTYTLCSWNSDRISLVRVREGKRNEVWARDAGLIPEQWYRVRGEISGRIYSLYIDSHEVFSLEDNELKRGRFGLYVNGEGGAHFDDAEVGGIRMFRLNADGDGLAPFSQIGGKWREEKGFFSCTATLPAKGVWGSDEWSNYTVSAVITPSRSGAAGVGCFYKGEGNYYLALFNADTKEIQLVSRRKGNDTVLGGSVLNGEPDSVKCLLSVYNSVITLKADGETLCSVMNRDHLEGRPFLYGENCYNTGFSDVEVFFRPYIEPVQDEHQIFSAEMTMAGWAGAKSDWVLEKEIFKGNTIMSLWNKASFPGDVLLEANIEKIGEQSKIRLMIGAPEKKLNAGYSFGLRGGTDREALLLRRDTVIARTPIEPAGKLYRIGFQRISDTVIGLLDGEIILSSKDPDPIRGTGVGWTVAGSGLSREDVWAYSSSVYNYKFTRSPCDWRAASGTWEVTNRWQCDPRWTFFSGHTDRGGAVIWNKRKFSGDITVEFHAGIKMDRSRGRKYSYASDINCIICGSGADAAQGYNFLFGGFGNEKTCITRNREIVASTATHVIPVNMKIHRRWFYVRIEKRGNTLSYFLDGKKILGFTDPVPLTGNRIGFWTYDNGIMIARVRISSESGRECEDPFGGYTPGSATIYE